MTQTLGMDMEAAGYFQVIIQMFVGLKSSSRLPLSATFSSFSNAAAVDQVYLCRSIPPFSFLPLSHILWHLSSLNLFPVDCVMDEEVVWFLYMLMGPLALPEFIQTPNGIILKVDLPLRVIYTTCTACGHRMAYRKWKETKLQPGTAGPGNLLVCCLVSFHFLWAILCPRAVLLLTPK